MARARDLTLRGAVRSHVVGNRVKELRKVIALAESGKLTLIETELSPLEEINDVYARLKRGEELDAR